MTLWFGLYDDQLFVEHGERRYGPYAPSGGPIPLHADHLGMPLAKLAPEQ